MPTSRKPARLVVDANPILSALLGGNARRVFFESAVEEFAVPERVLAEVRTYIPTLALKAGLHAAALELLLTLLPLSPYPEASYRRSIPEAARLIAHRDPGDVPPLALALHLDTPLWTNDRDFTRTGVTLFTTAQLLALLFPRHS